MGWWIKVIIKITMSMILNLWENDYKNNSVLSWIIKDDKLYDPIFAREKFKHIPGNNNDMTYVLEQNQSLRDYSILYK